MDLIYLDYNCFQRGFDDFRQMKIHMEALACQEIFIRAERNKVRLVGLLCMRMKRFSVLF